MSHQITPVRLGLIGAGRIGTMHARNIARRIPGAVLAAVADPVPGAADRLASELGAEATLDPAELVGSVDAVVITASATVHTELVIAAAEAGRPVFCEKPMALALADADRALGAVGAAGVPLQVGFNRRFAADFRAAHDLIIAGGIGTPQLMRSVTRDPAGAVADPGAVKPWTIFRETLIHDFDVLRWLNLNAEPVEVFATADALVAPEYKSQGLLDTAVVVVRFENGAIATAEASFSAAYGYDVRGEVFGSAGMVSAGDLRQNAMRFHGADGLAQQTVRGDVELFGDAYTAELASFVDCVREHRVPEVTGADARTALAIALAAMASVEQERPVRLTELDGYRTLDLTAQS
jgi:myo-inositol 2-dehydrogenase / D-chiro-inositol 1-dehydrogenase